MNNIVQILPASVIIHSKQHIYWWKPQSHTWCTGYCCL